MISSTIFIRVITQDRDRGFALLVGYDAKLVQSTAIQIITLSVPSRAGLDQAIAYVKRSYNASEVRDVTATGIVKRLKKLFGEIEPKEEKTE